ncbi:MAG: class I SAM-dependent methyltransferase [Inquilinus sp.]|nr:class I SAM-dependent methyltransferase [Inquilinus sp.]
MTQPQSRRDLDVFDELVAVADRDVADIGCGRGGLVRALVERGARPTGIECGSAALAAAKAAAIGDERYLEGTAQALPLADASQDLVVFFNSLHHVPVADQPAALREAVRVLRPGGRAYVLEPLAEGPYFEMVRPLNDETEVRAAAYAALKAAGDFAELSETVYANRSNSPPSRISATASSPSIRRCAVLFSPPGNRSWRPVSCATLTARPAPTDCASRRA